MNFKTMSIRAKLILTFVVVGATPLIVSSLISHSQTSSEIQHQAQEIAKLVAEDKIHGLEYYFEGEKKSIIDLAATGSTISALEQFSEPFSNPPQNNDWIEKYKAEVSKFYSSKFGSAYFEKAKKKLPVENIVSKLDPLSLAAQYDFIVTNDHPLGKKDELLTPLRGSPYASVHTEFHPFFREYLTRHGLYDLFLVNAEGRVVYSVFKETDFATSLRNGPWAQSNLARAFESSSKLEAGEVHVEDFELYTPSYESPAAFTSTPIFKNGKFIGSLIVQIPFEKIAAIVGSRDGLGAKGEVLLMGPTGRLRADTFRNKETHNVLSAFDPDSKATVESEAVRKAREGAKGFMENVSYDGLETVAYYSNLKLDNLTWYIVVELSQDEVYAALAKIDLYSIIILVTGIVVIASAALIFGNLISRNLSAIVETLDYSSKEISGASSQSAASATELSEASTEQAASLQQTMASVEEISAMVSQNAESASKTQIAVNTNQKVSEEGSKSVDEMMGAIAEIKETNEEILAQMESSNKEFGEIVKIISEIGEKTNVINEIVFQTKLLSFNASVEAARAGEHGKGFAVVAEEVGNLAQMSGNAAKEITDMLSDSIKRVNTIVDGTKSRVDHLVEVGKDKIAMGQSTAEKCRDALNKIRENAQSVVSMITEITHASKEQAQGIQEINKAISQLDQVTQQNSAVAQQSSSQAEQLNTEAHSLGDAVKKLVAFVDGAGGSQDESQHDRQEQSQNSRVNRIIPISRGKNQNSAGGKKTASPRDKEVSKKAVGSSQVPSSNDPSFEEF